MTHEIQTASSAYQFTVYPADMQFNRLSGIYIFLIIPRHPELVSGSHPKNHHETHTQHPASRHPELACTEQSRSIEGPQYSLLYIGITNNFYARLKQHHKIAAAYELGMTHIGILKITSGRKRKKIEREILKHLNPPLNQTWLS